MSSQIKTSPFSCLRKPGQMCLSWLLLLRQPANGWIVFSSSEVLMTTVNLIAHCSSIFHIEPKNHQAIPEANTTTLHGSNNYSRLQGLLWYILWQYVIVEWIASKLWNITSLTFSFSAVASWYVGAAPPTLKIRGGPELESWKCPHRTHFTWASTHGHTNISGRHGTSHGSR